MNFTDKLKDNPVGLSMHNILSFLSTILANEYWRYADSLNHDQKD